MDGTFAVLEAAAPPGRQALRLCGVVLLLRHSRDLSDARNRAGRPRYPYALTKYLGEQHVMHWAQIYGLPAVSLRFFNVYGPRARTSGTYGAVFGVFLAQLLAQAVDVVGDGEQTRDFTYVSDVVDALLTAAESGRVGRDLQRRQRQTGQREQLVRLLGSPPTVHIPKRPGEPDCTWADITQDHAPYRLEARRYSLPSGVRVMRENIDYWRDAPVWTAAGIAEATSDWFRISRSERRR